MAMAQLALTAALRLALLARAAPTPPATCGDCREGDFNDPRIYFYWTNTTAAQCCDLCSANKTCAFAIHDGTVGSCFPSPASSTSFKSQGGIQTCRAARAPPWPAPTPPAPPPFALSVWPQVSVHGNATGGSQHAGASATIKVQCGGGSGDGGGGCPNSQQLGWYQQRLRADAPDPPNSDSQHPIVPPTGGLITTVSVSVTQGAHTVMLPDTDESYTIDCHAGAACHIGSVTTTGALRGLETLAHLAHGQAIPIPLTLSDAPRFPYRGLLIDSARHFIPIGNIKRMIDGMSTAKLNVLHWHLIDIESFPVQSERYPLLSGKGAFKPNLVYTKDNLTDIVHYGGLRGVRIMPEFDIPGHAGWAFGHPGA